MTEHDGHKVFALTKTTEPSGVKRMVSPVLWHELVKLWSSENDLEHSKPWWIHMSLASMLLPPQSDGVETQLLAMGKKTHIYLEPAEELVTALDAVPPEEYLSQLETILDRRPELPLRFLRLYECWSIGIWTG